MTDLLAEIRRQRFLVIDPSAHTRSTMAQMLRAAGAVKTECVVSVAEAVDRCRTLAPTVIITEWNLGYLNEDGMALTKKIRHSETPFARDAGVIVVTDRCTRADVETARITGVDEYLMRPYSTGALVDRLKGVILHRRPFVDCAVYIGPCRRRKMIVDYPGEKKRRLSDDIDEAASGIEVELVKNLARAKLASAAESARVVDPARVKEVHRIAGDLLSIAESVNDPALSMVAISLRGYIESVGASPRFDTEVVAAHIDAMTQIINLPNVETSLRDEVTKALQKLVAKRTRAVAA